MNLLPKELIFNSKLTTYANLDKLNKLDGQGVKSREAIMAQCWSLP